MPLLIVVNSEGKKIPLSRDEKEFLIEEIYSSIQRVQFGSARSVQNQTDYVDQSSQVDLYFNHRGSKRTLGDVSVSQN